MKQLLIAIFFTLFCCIGCSRTSIQPHDMPNKPMVASLAPNITETIIAIGGQDQLVGRTSACDYPPKIVASIPIIGDFGRPTLEMLATVQPDILIDVDMEDESIIPAIKDLGINHERIFCQTPLDIPNSIIAIGKIINQELNAQQLANKISSQLEALKKINNSTDFKPSVFVEIWSDPIMTAGKGSYVSEMIQLAGGINIGDISDTDYYAVDPEWVIESNPDIIICLYTINAKNGEELISNRQGWNTITAVKNKKVFCNFNNNTILRPGPRVINGLNQLRESITSI